jgi:prepilin-type N-terminal cleavage/methylation domain-containing protein
MRASTRGFTLIELVIVLVLIGILAAVAIPRFADMRDNAEEASMRGTMGNVRSAITIWRANSLAEGTDAWPPFLNFADVVLSTVMPDNPWVAGGPDNSVADGGGLAVDDRDIIAGGAGWAYNEDEGTFWANTDLGADGLGAANENEW